MYLCNTSSYLICPTACFLKGAFPRIHSGCLSPKGGNWECTLKRVMPIAGLTWPIPNEYDPSLKHPKKGTKNCQVRTCWLIRVMNRVCMHHNCHNVTSFTSSIPKDQRKVSAASLSFGPILVFGLHSPTTSLGNPFNYRVNFLGPTWPFLKLAAYLWK